MRKKKEKGGRSIGELSHLFRVHLPFLFLKKLGQRKRKGGKTSIGETRFTGGGLTEPRSVANGRTGNKNGTTSTGERNLPTQQ